MKTKPMAHQVTGLERMDGKEHYGLGAEQGTGKTWMLLADAERLFLNRVIKASLVIAPNGVHTNWTRREIPAHMDIPVQTESWQSGAGVRKTRSMADMLKAHDPDVLRVFSMNVDALNTKKGVEFAAAFIRAHKGDVELIVDESTRVKNLSAGRTKQAVMLAERCRVRRIASGTMIANSPLDLFGQFEVMAPGAGLLGTRSYRAFVAEYAELMRPEASLVRDILARSTRPQAKKVLEKLRAGEDLGRGDMLQLPQIILQNPDGTKRWRNLEKLRGLMAPHVFRVLKKDCLDLPPKVYQTVYFELTPAQRRDYTAVCEQLRWIRDNGQVDKFTALTLTTKLRQIASGFINLDGRGTRLIASAENPKLAVLREVLEDLEGQFIVWCSFHEELAQVREELDALGISCVEYHGLITSKTDREEAVDAFQRGDARCFLGTADAGGIGLTLTAADTAVYYNRDFSLEKRLQSEDRNHRIGTTGNYEGHVLYIDIVAQDTADERVTTALQNKEEVADRILNYI